MSFRTIAGFVAVSALSLVMASSTQAAPILVQLSEFSNNEGEANGVDNTELNAEFLFTVVGTTLTIEVTNTTDTLSLQDYDISAFNFNFNSTDVTGLTLTSFPSIDAGWAQGATTAGGTGQWDDGANINPDLTFGEKGLNPDLINAGETGVFTYSFTCLGTCDESDFVVANNKNYVLAAKFINGGGIGGASAWGASATSTIVIPEPATTSLLLLAFSAAFMGRRQSRA